MEEKLMDTSDLAGMLALNIKTVQKIIREEGDFPKPIMITKHTRRWKYSDILEWINTRHETNV